MRMGFAGGFASFVAVRVVLGLAEGGLLPGTVLYLLGLCTRAELALRIGIFYSAASLSGAFGGASRPPAAAQRAAAADAAADRPARARPLGHLARRRPRALTLDLHR